MPTLEQQEIALLKGRIARLEARLEFLYKHLGLTFVAEANATDDPDVIQALKANNMLEAIKRYRMATNASLEEAKSAIEQMRGRLGI
jgi:ribosomal protein L7/L12